MRLPVLLSTVAAALMPVCAVAQDSRPVLVGGEAQLDACGAVGQVTGLDPNGDNFLSVRTGPGVEFQRIDRLGPNQLVTLCDNAGNWHGVVYTLEPGIDCGVSSPQSNRAPYAGPCKSGWVYARYVTLIAG